MYAELNQFTIAIYLHAKWPKNGNEKEEKAKNREREMQSFPEFYGVHFNLMHRDVLQELRFYHVSVLSAYLVCLKKNSMACFKAKSVQN